MNLWFNQPKKLAKVSAVQPSTIIGLSRVPSFSTPRWPLLSKSMVWRNSEWVANQVASTLKPWPSTFRKTQYWSSRWTNNSTHREDNHEDLMVEIGMKKFRVLGVGWESGHVELLRMVREATIYMYRDVFNRTKHASLPSSTLSNTLVDCGASCIPKTIPNLSYWIFLRRLRKCGSSLPPIIWTINHCWRISNSSFVDWNSGVWVPAFGMGWKHRYWVHYTPDSHWWKMDVSKRWLH